MFTVSLHPCLKIKQEKERKLFEKNSPFSPFLLLDLYSDDCATVKSTNWNFDVQIK